jgi:hypothetical protein
MAEQRLILAIGRMERALARLEHCAPRAAEGEANAQALAARHRRLREAAAEAVARIDQLLGPAEG